MRLNKLKQILEVNGEETEIGDGCLAPTRGSRRAKETAPASGCVAVVDEGGRTVRRSRRLREIDGSAIEGVVEVDWDSEYVCEAKLEIVERERCLMESQPTRVDVEEVCVIELKDEEDEVWSDWETRDFGSESEEEDVRENEGTRDVGVQTDSPSLVEVGTQHHEETKAKVTYWGQEERSVLWEVYEESMLESPKSFNKVVARKWAERGMRAMSMAALSAQITAIKKDERKLGALDRERISRKVKDRVAVTLSVTSVSAESAVEVTPSDSASVARQDTSPPVCAHASVSREVFWKEGNDVSTELDCEKRAVLARLREVYAMEVIGDVPSLKTRNRQGVNREVRLVNGMIHNIVTRSATETNKLLYAGSYVVAERLGLIREKSDKRGKREERKDPWWKRRLEASIKRWRADLSRIECVLRGNELSKKVKERLERLYELTRKGALGVKVSLKMKVQAGSTKIQRYQERNIQFHQNNLFKNNQSNLYKELSGQTKGDNPAPDASEATEFWGGIWSQGSNHRKDAEWIPRVREVLEGKERQDNVRILLSDVRAGVRRMTCWKAAGPDGVRGFWFKKFSNLHQQITDDLQECLTNGDVPEWMVKGRTVLIQKDPAKGRVASNYRPIACLPLMWKLLSGIFADKVYGHLKSIDVLPAEQKGCRKQSRGTKDQLLIDKAVLLKAKSKRANLAMAWVDYKKAYDMVPHSWLLEVIKMMGVAPNVRGLMENSMKKWKTELSADGEQLGTVPIKRGIFQGDSFSPLLFVMIMIPLSMILKENKAGFKFGNAGESLNHLLFMDDLKLYASNKSELDVLVKEVHAYSSDICMEFGMDKCATLITVKGTRVSSEGVKLPSGETMKDVDEEGYKYLGVLQNENTMNRVMKDRVRDEYFRRVKLLAKSKLYARNLIAGINAWAIGVVRYSAGIIDWTKNDLEHMDKKTRRILTMNGAFNRKSGVGRLYLKRKEGGRGLISVSDCVACERRNLCEYVGSSNEWMLKVVKEDGLLSETESKKVYEERVSQERKEDMEGKSVHGKFFRDTKEVSGPRSYDWLKGGYLGKATEAYICAAQENVLETRGRKKYIYGEDVNPKCRICGLWDENVRHLASGCEELAKRQYVIRHDNMGKRVHWELCRKYGIECGEKWYEHVPLNVMEGQGVEIYWNQTIWVHTSVEHNRPDVVVVDHNEKKWYCIDFSVPMDKNVVKKEDEKLARYEILTQRIRSMHTVRSEVIPIVIGALGTVPNRLPGYLEKLGIPDITGCLQKSALLGTQRILKNVLCI